MAVMPKYYKIHTKIQTDGYSVELEPIYIDLVPAVREKGEWLLDGRCSNCLENPLTTHKNFCPNCGADMRAEEQNRERKRWTRMKCKYEGSGAWEGRCVGTKEVDPCIGIEKCERYKPNCLTNADRIRAMSDEELAAFLSEWAERSLAWYGEYGETLAWLKELVKDGENE